MITPFRRDNAYRDLGPGMHHVCVLHWTVLHCIASHCIIRVYVAMVIIFVYYMWLSVFVVFGFQLNQEACSYLLAIYLLSTVVLTSCLFSSVL